MTGKVTTGFDKQEILGKLQDRAIQQNGSQRTQGSKCKLPERKDGFCRQTMKYFWLRICLISLRLLIKYQLNEIKIIQWGRENLPFDVLLKKTASEYPKPSDLDLPFPSPFSYVPTQSEIFLCGYLYFPSCQQLSYALES